MAKKISIEVYRDIETPDVDPQLAVAGIELVNELTDASLEIANITQKICLSKAGAQIIKSSNVRWPESPLDMSVVLTGRELHIEQGSITVGFSNIDGGVSVVSTFGEGAVSPQSTTAHELGHLFKMKYEGDDRMHCSNPACVMHSQLITHREERHIQKYGIQAWRERRGYQLAEYRIVEAASNESFCEPCQYQLATRAFFMVARKNAKLTPESY